MVTKVPQHKWKHDERQPVLTPYVTEDVETSPGEKDYGHMLWKRFMFPSEEEDRHTYHSKDILRILQNHDSASFTIPTTTKALQDSHLRLLQANGGANTSVTNNSSLLHT